MYHIIYWISFIIFFSFIWGTYDNDYYRNFMVQLWSLPARLIVVYVTSLVLFPKFMGNERFLTFWVYFFILLIAVGVAIQRPVMIFVVEGVYLPYKSAHFFKVTQLANTVIDVGIAAIIPLSYKFYSVWYESKHEIEELILQNQRLTGRNKDNFVVIKEGAISHKILFSDILFVESLRNYLRIKTKENEYKSYGSISSFQQEVPGDRFLRIHRSFIINIDHLQSFSSKWITIDGIDIPIGRKYRENLEKTLNN